MYVHSLQGLQHPCKAQLLPPSEPALGCLYTTQVLEPCAGKSSWGRASKPAEGQSSKHQVPIDVMAGWAATRVPIVQLDIDWSNVSKVSCSWKQQQIGILTGHRTWNLSITNSSHLAVLSHDVNVHIICMYMYMYICTLCVCIIYVCMCMYT